MSRKHFTDPLGNSAVLQQCVFYNLQIITENKEKLQAVMVLAKSHKKIHTSWTQHDRPNPVNESDTTN